MEVRLLGPFEAHDDGRPLALGGRKQRALLALLALNAGRTLSTERLVDELWGEDVPETAAKMVQIHVSQLRKAVPADVLVTRAPGYALELEPDAVDALRVERLVAAGRAALARGDGAAALAELEEALGLWRGAALAEFAPEPFARAEGPRLEELRLATLEERLEAELALGRHGEIAGELESLVARHPLRERLRRQLLLALYRSGRQADALAAYQSYRRLLDEELGIEPSVALRELELSLLRQDPALAAPRSAEARRPQPAVPAARSPVGREPELDALRAAFAAASDGTRRVVFVTGETGIGKTTLVDAFLAEAGASGGPTVARGQSVEQGGASEAYLPVLDALGRLGRDERGGELVRLLGLRAPTWLAQLPGLVGPLELEALERRTLGATRERMLREMLETLEELTAERPFVLVLEDLHWADPSTVDLLGAIARRQEPARLLVVGTFLLAAGSREEPSVVGAARELRARGRCLDVRLGPLGREAVAALVGARAGDEQGARLAHLVHERTGGNPLFVERLLDDWLAEDGPLAAGAGPDDLAGRVPDSLGQLVEQRLQRLDPRDAALLEAASVAGREFAAAAAAAALELPDDDVERRCVALARGGEIVREEGAVEWPDGTLTARFAFTHALFHDVLYERIPPGVRAGLHRRVGERLERGHGDRSRELAAELAHHFVRARAGARALEHLHRAAEHALRLSANTEALSYVDTGLELLPELAAGEERIRGELGLRLLEGTLLVATRSWASPEAERSLVRALELAEELGEPDLLATALYRLASLHEVRGEYRRSEELLRRALDLPGRSADGRLVVESHELMACSLFHQGEFERALEHAEHGLDAYDGLPGDAVAAAYGDNAGVGCHSWAGLSLWALGRLEDAAERARDAVALADDDRRGHGRATALGQAAKLAQLRGDADETRALADRAIEAATLNGYAYRTAMGLVLRGWARAATGDVEAGIEELEAGLRLSRETGGRMDDAYYLGLLAEARLHAGREDEAEAALAEARDLVDASRAYFFEAELHRLAGMIAQRRGEVERARAAFARALEIARSQGSRTLELRAALALARLPGGDDLALRRVAAALRGEPRTPDLAAAEELLGRRAAGPGETARSSGVAYAQSGDLSIAYEVTGGGPLDLVLVPGFVSHLQKDWEEPRHARFLDRLGSFARLIRFDKRGTGLSDRPGGLPDLETRMDDVRAVMDAAGSERAVLFGYSEGAPMAILFAATYPERVRALVLYAGYATRLRKDDYPWAATVEERRAYGDRIEREWGWEADMERMCPSADDDLARWWGERARAAASPGAARALIEMNSQIDVRDVLGTIRVPTLVLHRTGDVDVRVEEGRYLADRIAGARLVELPGVDHFVAVDPDQILDQVEPFVGSLGRSAPAQPEPERGERVLATIFVSDLPKAAETLAEVGDRAWAEILLRYDAVLREELARHGAADVDRAGEGFIATFDGPGRGIRCALAVQERLRRLGLEASLGLHTGEIIRCDGDLRGIAVHTAARVAAESAPGEILVTATTRDLVAGSGLAFADGGERHLKGIEGPRRLYAVADGVLHPQPAFARA